MSDADLPYRPCVGAMLLNARGLVFVGKRLQGGDESESDHSWQMPQGGVDPGEDLLEAAKRELFEETNVSSVALLAEAPDWYSYDIPRDVVGARWKKKWRGQTQRWFAFRFTGPESEINVTRPGDGRFEAEFSAWRWVPMDDLPGLIVPFKRPVYENVVAAFGHLAGR
jgi:putative (di)nucleoside polyphosphate hydrolase